MSVVLFTILYYHLSKKKNYFAVTLISIVIVICEMLLLLVSYKSSLGDFLLTSIITMPISWVLGYVFSKLSYRKTKNNTVPVLLVDPDEDTLQLFLKFAVKRRNIGKHINPTHLQWLYDKVMKDETISETSKIELKKVLINNNIIHTYNMLDNDIKKTQQVMRDATTMKHDKSSLLVELKGLKTYLSDAEKLMDVDKDSFLMKCRKYSEGIAHIVTKMNNFDTSGMALYDMLNLIGNHGLIPHQHISILHDIRKNANTGVHHDNDNYQANDDKPLSSYIVGCKEIYVHVMELLVAQ